jgi:hypothetical protein
MADLYSVPTKSELSMNILSRRFGNPSPGGGV